MGKIVGSEKKTNTEVLKLKLKKKKLTQSTQGKNFSGHIKRHTSIFKDILEKNPGK
jgi:hypothetical protein